MSLTELLRRSSTRDRARRLIDPFIPEFRRTLATRPRVENSSGHPQLVGIAFDYALRLELAHRAPVSAATWAAEVAVAKLRHTGSRRAGRAARVVRQARAAAKEGWSDGAAERYAHIAAHAAKLAQLDQVLRAGYPPTFGEEDGVREAEIAEEVARLLSLGKPMWDLAVVRSPLVLNPTFGAASLLVGGADADLIAGQELIEIKTTREARIELDHMRQLIGYVSLARASEADLPRITSVGVYFSRFGILERVEIPRSLDARSGRVLATRLAELWRGRLAA